MSNAGTFTGLVKDERTALGEESMRSVDKSKGKFEMPVRH